MSGMLIVSTIASDIAQNPYWKRDVRRAYPQLSVITQSELSALLIEHSTPQAYVFVTIAHADVLKFIHGQCGRAC